MAFWNTLLEWVSSSESATSDHHLPSHQQPPVINPSTNLPMVDEIGGVDVGGSPYGIDIHHEETPPSIDPFRQEW